MNLLDNPSGLNKYLVVNGLNVNQKYDVVSGYVLECKIKKILYKFPKKEFQKKYSNDYVTCLVTDIGIYDYYDILNKIQKEQDSNVLSELHSILNEKSLELFLLKIFNPKKTTEELIDYLEQQMKKK